MATLSPWFPATRGTVLGLADSGNPLGQAIFTPLAQGLVLGIGWRWSFRIVGLIFFLLVFPLNLFFQKGVGAPMKQMAHLLVHREIAYF